MHHSTSGTNEKEKSKKTIQIILPFLGTVTGKVERSLQKALKTHLPNYKINVISRASTRLSNLFSFKDKIPSYLNHCVVYKFTCGGCNSTYIGQTTRHIKTRFSEHLGISALTSQPVKGQTPTAVTEHIKKKNCIADFNIFSILCKDTSSDYILQVKESLYAYKEKPDITTKCIGLSLFKQ